MFARRLLSLLGRGLRPTKVLAEISGVVEGVSASLDGTPDLTSCWRSRLSTDKAVNSGTKLSELTLNEAALCVSCTEEGGVHNNQDPRSLGEDDGGEENTTPEQDLENGNKTHRGIIVLLDELANGISDGIWLEGLLSSWRGAGSWCDCLWRLNGWNEVGSGVGGSVENRVDTEWEHSQRVLRREEPDKCHSCRKLARASAANIEDTNPNIEHSHQKQ